MNLLDLQRDPSAFRAALLIDTDAGPKPLAECMDDWQADDFTALDSGWMRAVVGSKVKADYSRAWLERPRGHSKSLDLAVMATWALFASRRRLSLIGCAADLDQARLLRDAVGKLLLYNPWLSTILEIQVNRVINTKTESALEIIASDARSAYGLTPDGVIADEIVHWKNRDLWDAMLSSIAKRSTSMLVVITNAGLTTEWQFSTREAIACDPKWYFRALTGPQASWISRELLQEQERLLPANAYRRLWLNEWSQAGDLFSPEVLEAAFKSDLQSLTWADPSYTYCAGVDAGISRDCSAICCLGVRRGYAGHAEVRLVATKLWRPTKANKVDLGEVETALIELHRKLKLAQICYDPWELRFLASRLQAGGVGRMANPSDIKVALPLVEVSPTGANLQRIASAVLEAFNDRRVHLYHEPDLKRDLQRMRVVEKSYGFRIESPRDSTGHGDMGSAFALAMLAASELASKPVARAGVTAVSFDAGSRFQRRREQFHRERELLDRLNSQEGHDAAIREAMRRFAPERYHSQPR